MKVLLTGATGFIGSEVLNQLLAHPSVTSVVALTRRPLPPSPSSTHSKLQTIVNNDFTSYPPSLLSQVSDVDACIYTLGSYSSSQPAAEARQVNLDYTLAAAEAFARNVAPNVASSRHNEKPGTGKFRFVYTSGFLAERDQSKSLWFVAEMRKMRGEVENGLIGLSRDAKFSQSFETFITRPAGVRAKDGGLGSQVMGAMSKSLSIRVDELAAAMVEIAVQGSDRQNWDNEACLEKGRRALSAAT